LVVDIWNNLPVSTSASNGTMELKAYITWFMFLFSGWWISSSAWEYFETELWDVNYVMNTTDYVAFILGYYSVGGVIYGRWKHSYRLLSKLSSVNGRSANYMMSFFEEYRLINARNVFIDEVISVFATSHVSWQHVTTAICSFSFIDAVIDHKETCGRATNSGEWNYSKCGLRGDV